MSDVNSIGSAGPEDRRRWLILGVIGLAQLMVVLDVTVMNIALPSAQHALHFTTVDRQWVVTAYTLAFGSLLLLGGRLADLFGRKVTFLIGLLGFAGVSAIGGASVNFTMLITARACQGAFGAILVPSALSLLTTSNDEIPGRAPSQSERASISLSVPRVLTVMRCTLSSRFSNNTKKWRCGGGMVCANCSKSIVCGKPKSGKRRISNRPTLIKRRGAMPRSKSWIAYVLRLL